MSGHNTACADDQEFRLPVCLVRVNERNDLFTWNKIWVWTGDEQHIQLAGLDVCG